MSANLVVIFAYHYPPENAVGGARPFRFAKYLTRLGYDCRVFTAAAQARRNDPNIIYIPDPFTTDPPRGFGWHAERAIRKVFLPGEVGMRWSYRASRAARGCVREYVRAHSLANQNVRVTIFSTFPPLGTLLAGQRLARSENLRWIADFRDPLSGERAARGAFLPKLAYRLLERATVRSAEAVICNTETARTSLQRRFPALAEKIHTIWNGFDPETRVVPLPTVSGDCRVLSHAGELYAGRNATPILESIARLMASGRLSAGSIRARFVGPVEDGALPNRDFLNRAQAEDWLELVTKQVPQCEALRITRSSDYLLLLQPQSGTQVPGKLFEYLQIGRPILAFVQKGSPSERLLARSGVPFRCVYPEDSPAIVDDTVADFFHLRSAPVEASSWFEEQFNVERQTGQLDAILRSLHNEPMREANPSRELPVKPEETRFTRT